ncbi:MAG: permease [Rikenellaceae bacterium]
MEYLRELLNILNAMSPYILLGFFIAGLLHVYLPKSIFSRHLSQKGFKSVFLSALFGVPLPLCSCGVIPTAMSLKKEGASDGATVSFLISTPQTGIDSILASYGVLGLPFAIIRPIVAFVVGLGGGLLVNKFSPNNQSTTKQGESSSCAITNEKKPKLIDALKYGFVDMLQDLGKWLTVGLVIAAAITVFVPHSVFEVLSDYYILNLLFVLLLSIPMYICSTGSIPIALSLMMMGITPGAALVFLMAGPATNVATLAVLKKVMGTRTTILYLLSIILGAIGFAVLIDFALPAQWFALRVSTLNACDQCAEGAAWWHIASSVLFIGLLANAYIMKLRNGASHSHDIELPTTQEFKVAGMRCNHCKANVEKAIAALAGVTEVVVDLAAGVVRVEGDIPRDQVRKVVRQLGFKVE